MIPHTNFVITDTLRAKVLRESEDNPGYYRLEFYNINDTSIPPYILFFPTTHLEKVEGLFGSAWNYGVYGMWSRSTIFARLENLTNTRGIQQVLTERFGYPPALTYQCVSGTINGFLLVLLRWEFKDTRLFCIVRDFRLTPLETTLISDQTFDDLSPLVQSLNEFDNLNDDLLIQKISERLYDSPQRLKYKMSNY